MAIPENISVNNIQASIFSLLYKIFPHLQKSTKIKAKKQKKNLRINREIAYLRGASWVVNGAGEEDSTVAIDDYGLFVVGYAALDYGGSN